MKRIIKAVALFIVGGVALALIGIFLWKFPTHQVQGYRAQIDEKKPFDKDRAEHDREMLKLENELRGNYAQIIGGFVLLVGLYLTWRKQNHEERTANQTLRLTEDGKITERYSKAIELLGSDNLAMRIGGIYALERIARDSQKDHWTVMEALCAFIRDESNKVATTPQATKQPPTSEKGDQQTPDSKSDVEQPKPRTDIQIAVTVVSRRSWVYTEHRQGLRLDLSKAYLPNADLTKAELSWVNLGEANLVGANLNGASLREANLSNANLIATNLKRADLSWADLSGADLSDADPVGARLRNTNLSGANLSGANLRWADLRGANPVRASLRCADLRGANLRDTNLITTNLGGVQYDSETLFPEGFTLVRLKPDTNEGAE